MASAAKSPLSTELLRPSPPERDPFDFVSSGANRPGVLRGAARLLRLTLRYGASGGPFLAQLGSQATLVCESARILSTSVADGTLMNARRQLRSLAVQGREIECSLVTGLISTPFAPLTQEDLHAVSVILAAILDNFVDIAGLPPASWLFDTGLLETSQFCAEKIRTAVSALPSGRNLRDSTADLGICARKAEFLLRDLVLQKAVPDSDPIRLLKSTHAASALRSLFRRYRWAGRALDHTILRNG